MERLDAWILGMAERFAHRFQRLTGRNCFWLARAAWFAHLAGIVLSAFVPYRAGTPIPPGAQEMRLPFMTCFALAMYFFGRTLFGRILGQLEAHYEDAPRTGHPFTLAWRGFWYLRIPWMMVMLALISATGMDISSPRFWVREVLWYQIFSVAYLLAVIPLPPGRSKIRQWLDSLFFVPQLDEAKSSAR